MVTFRIAERASLLRIFFSRPCYELKGVCRALAPIAGSASAVAAEGRTVGGITDQSGRSWPFNAHQRVLKGGKMYGKFAKTRCDFILIIIFVFPRFCKATTTVTNRTIRSELHNN